MWILRPKMNKIGHISIAKESIKFVQNIKFVPMPIYGHMVFGPQLNHFLSNLDENSYTSSGDQ